MKVNSSDLAGALPVRGRRHLLLVWLIYAGVVAFCTFVAWYQGALQLVYATDRSRICWIITLIFIVTTVHAARRIMLLSAEQDAAARIRSMLEGWPAPVLIRDAKGLQIEGEGRLPGSLLSNYLDDVLANRSQMPGAMSEHSPERSDLTEVYRHQLRDPNEFGWFMADVMIKLGLLGTIVGFVLMLGSVSDVANFNASTMQGVLKNMSVGMGTALYTTFAGLVCSILTTAQYHLLDQAADELVGTAIHLSQTRIFPARPPTAG